MATTQRSRTRTETDAPRFTRDPDGRRRPRRRAGASATAAPRAARADTAAAPARDWRGDVLLGSGLNLVAGAWLLAAPFVLGYAFGRSTWADLVVGALVAALAVVRVTQPWRAPELSWVNTALGLALFAWAFWYDRLAAPMWNDAIAGGLVFVFGIISASASETGDPAVARRGGTR